MVPGYPETNNSSLKMDGWNTTLPETNSSPMKIPMFPCKFHQNGGFSMAMLVLGRVISFLGRLFIFSGDLAVGFQGGKFSPMVFYDSLRFPGSKP